MIVIVALTTAPLLACSTPPEAAPAATTSAPVDTAAERVATSPSSAAPEEAARTPPITAVAPPDHPAPSFRLAVDANTTVELYEFSSGVLVREEGKAGVSQPVLSRYQDLVQSRRVVDLFRAIKPDSSVPSELVALEARLNSLHAGSPPKVGITRTPSAEADGLAAEDTASAAAKSAGVRPDNVCNNGCCDWSWLQNNLCTNLSGWPYTWFLFNYGYDYANSNSMDAYGGHVCSAIGTSTFGVSITDGSGGTWSVPQGNYISYGWLAGCYFLNCPSYQAISTSVNSQYNQHTHTYCGWFNW
jgi:hypothetical protein